jgi:hypothetical protein
MRHISVILTFDEKKLGEKWMNEDNLKILLYTEQATKEELLQISGYLEVD